jgi:hypothetical protein
LLEPRTQKMIEVWVLAPPKHGDEQAGREDACSYTHLLELQLVGMFFQVPEPASRSTSMSWVSTR